MALIQKTITLDGTKYSVWTLSRAGIKLEALRKKRKVAVANEYHKLCKGEK